MVNRNSAPDTHQLQKYLYIIKRTQSWQVEWRREIGRNKLPGKNLTQDHVGQVPHYLKQASSKPFKLKFVFLLL